MAESNSITEKPADKNKKTPTDNPKVLFHRKLVAVRDGISRIPKNGFNEHHNYAYATEADVVEGIRGLLSEQGLSMTIEVTISRYREKEGSKMVVTTVPMVIKITDIDTGYEEVYEWEGSGEDPGDKGLYKAITGGQKYFLMKTFLVPTGDDPERAEATSALPAKENKEAHRVIREYIEKAKTVEDFKEVYKCVTQFRKLGHIGDAEAEYYHASITTMGKITKTFVEVPDESVGQD